MNVVIFTFFVTYAAIDSYQRASHLHDIQSRQYPIQENLVSALHNLEFIQSTLETAVVTGDDELLLSLSTLKNDFIHRLDSTIELDDGYSDNLMILKLKFTKYFDSSYELAVEMINNLYNYESYIDRGKANSIFYKDVLTDLQHHKTNHDINFNSNIRSAAALAEKSVIFIALVGTLSAVFVLTIAIGTSRRVNGRITEINRSLRDIALDNGDMNVQLSLEGNDEISELAFWFNSIIKKLKTLTERSTYEIKRIAYLDFLTGLPNRRWLMERLEEECNIAKNKADSLFLLILDLDNFKPINDQFGHDAGDEVIRRVAEKLNFIVSGESIADVNIEKITNRPVIGRIGGDEFMAVLPGTLSREEVTSTCISICEELTKPMQLKGSIFSIGVSIGISKFLDNTRDHQELVDYADMAMYQSKLDGKNRYTFFNQEIEHELSELNTLKSELKTAIENDEFTIVYQPKFETSSQKYAGAEALIRWQNKKLGFVSPAKFIPIAEKHNLIVDIDRWMINAVCSQLSKWTKRDSILNRVAINISAEFIGNLEFPDYLEETARRHNVDMSGLEIEITETSALENLDNVKTNIDRIRNNAVTVAMDDFGAGHSSLQLLLNCQIDSLKIDKSLIDEIEQSQKTLSLVTSLISLSKILNLKTVAEGVETETQLSKLREVKCDIAQGYLLAKPMSLVDLLKHTKTHNKPVLKLAS